MYYLAAILFSALVIGMAFLPVFTYKGSLTGTTNINAFQLMSGSFSENLKSAALPASSTRRLANSKTCASLRYFCLSR